MRENNKKTFPKPLKDALDKAVKEGWSTDMGSGFTDEQVIRTSGNYVIIDDYGDGIGHRYAFKDLNRRELEIVADWILAGNKFKRRN